MAAILQPVRFSKNLSPGYHNALGTLDASTMGGKGAGLIAMTRDGLNVPPGFIFGVSWCHDYQKNPEKTMAAVKTRLVAEMTWLRAEAKLVTVTPVAPSSEMEPTATLTYELPLMSVRSGAPISMPGMMDTILNVGLTMGTMNFWNHKLGTRAVTDCYRRLIQMMGVTAFDVPHEKFEAVLNDVKASSGVKDDKDLSENALTAVTAKFMSVFKEHTGREFPDTIEEQLLISIETVFKSWDSDRAKVYRKLNNIPDSLGTAVTVQRMVFGNLGPTSGTGVMFTRSRTGEKKVLIDYLDNAQGEDVVAGIRTPYYPKDGKLVKQLLAVADQLEKRYRDMVDIEFTVEEGQLFLLQSRRGKRESGAALKIAFDLIDEGLREADELPELIKRSDIAQLLKPTLDPAFKVPPVAMGIDASGGFAQGEVVFTSEAAINCKKQGKPCILVRLETSPDDIGGMIAADGVLTAQGGSTSHAAVVARGMNKPCVVGCQELKFDVAGAWLPAGTFLPEGTKIAIDGDTGRIWKDVELPVVPPDMTALKKLAAIMDGTIRAKGMFWNAVNIIGATEPGALELAAKADEMFYFDMSSPIDRYSVTDREYGDLCGTVDDQLMAHVHQGAALIKAIQIGGPHATVQPVYPQIPSLINPKDKVNVGQFLFGEYKEPMFLSHESLQEIGGAEALDRIRKALGRPTPPLIQVVPVEYALFSALND